MFEIKKFYLSAIFISIIFVISSFSSQQAEIVFEIKEVRTYLDRKRADIFLSFDNPIAWYSDDAIIPYLKKAENIYLQLVKDASVSLSLTSIKGKRLLPFGVTSAVDSKKMRKRLEKSSDQLPSSSHRVKIEKDQIIDEARKLAESLANFSRAEVDFWLASIDDSKIMDQHARIREAIFKIYESCSSWLKIVPVTQIRLRAKEALEARFSLGFENTILVENYVMPLGLLKDFYDQIVSQEIKNESSRVNLKNLAICLIKYTHESIDPNVIIRIAKERLKTDLRLIEFYRTILQLFSDRKAATDINFVLKNIQKMRVSIEKYLSNFGVSDETDQAHVFIVSLLGAIEIVLRSPDFVNQHKDMALSHYDVLGNLKKTELLSEQEQLESRHHLNTEAASANVFFDTREHLVNAANLIFQKEENSDLKKIVEIILKHTISSKNCHFVQNEIDAIVGIQSQTNYSTLFKIFASEPVKKASENNNFIEMLETIKRQVLSVKIKDFEEELIVFLDRARDYCLKNSLELDADDVIEEINESLYQKFDPFYERLVGKYKAVQMATNSPVIKDFLQIMYNATINKIPCRVAIESIRPLQGKIDSQESFSQFIDIICTAKCEETVLVKAILADHKIILLHQLFEFKKALYRNSIVEAIYRKIEDEGSKQFYMYLKNFLEELDSFNDWVPKYYIPGLQMRIDFDAITPYWDTNSQQAVIYTPKEAP